MANTPVDDERLPYLQILEDLRSSIIRGEIPLGEKLPSNAELKRKYGVASQTAQNAINMLKSEGLVYGVAGRGVFVRSDADLESLKKDFEANSAVETNSQEPIVDRLNDLTQRVTFLEGKVRDLVQKLESQTEEGEG